MARNILRARKRDAHAVIEVGVDKPGQMARYADLLRPEIAIVTSVGSEHQRSFGTLERTRDEKAEMVRRLGAGGLAVLNGDDPNAAWMQSQTEARVVTFGFGAHNDVVASDVVLEWPRGNRFQIRVGNESRLVRLRLLGLPGVYAALGAIAVAQAEGRSLDDVIPALENLSSTRARLQVVPLGDEIYLLRDDFKSTLETVDVALDVLEQIPAKRKLIVMGEISEAQRPQGRIYRRIAERMLEIAEQSVVVGGTFSHHATGKLARALRTGEIFDAKRSIRSAALEIRRDLRPGDVVLIKGRDTQHLGRIAMLIAGREVLCETDFCQAKIPCEMCPMLELA